MKRYIGFALGGIVLGVFAAIPVLLILIFTQTPAENFLQQYERNLRNYSHGMADGAARATRMCVK